MKHAEAKTILVKIEMRRDQVIVVIKDDGKGFDKTVKKQESFGLIGMRERVELLEGELSIDSKIGSGTLVMINVPIKTT